jgi:hypothetical protein
LYSHDKATLLPAQAAHDPNIAQTFDRQALSTIRIRDFIVQRRGRGQEHAFDVTRHPMQNSMTSITDIAATENAVP